MRFKDKAELTEWALGAEHLWLFLDYDGTLSEFAPTPDVIEMNPAVNTLIRRLIDKPNIRVMVVSGRKLDHLTMLLPISDIVLAGTYGIEMRRETGETISQVVYEDIRPLLEAIKPKWQELIDGRTGFFLEDKGWALALHGRHADPDEADEVLALGRAVLDGDSIPEHFRILGGYKFLEITPLLANKGKTVARLLEEYPLSGARLLYMGDDDKDEEAFEAIQAAGGVAVKVGQSSEDLHPTTADFILDSPADVLEWLETLL